MAINKLNLKAKTLWIPLFLIVATFCVMGAVFYMVTYSSFDDVSSSILSALKEDMTAAGSEQQAQDTLSNYFVTISEISIAEIKALITRTIFVNVFVMVPALIIISFVLYTSSGNIVRSVNQLLEAFGRQAQGDLTREVEVSSGDEIAQLSRAFNQTNRKLNAMLLEVSSGSSSVAESAGQLSDTSAKITENAQDQSDRTRQAATAMEELNASFVDVASNTANAADSARQATELALNGGDVVSKTINGMDDISRSVNDSSTTVEALGSRSEQIGEIVKVINDIAGQTNLLALNAAIEAARAGEQGRGFAVVADEVRKLAERTTTATNEISDMIKGIQDDTGRAVDSMRAGTAAVDTGVSLANQAGEALQQIVSSVQDVTNLVQQIATAAEQQSSTGGEVASSIETVAEITAQTTDAVGNSSQLSEQLNSLSLKLQQIVGGFKLRSGGPGTAGAAASQADKATGGVRGVF